MVGSVTSLSSNGVIAGNISASRTGPSAQVNRQIGDLGKALANNDVAQAQSAVAALRTAAPTQNANTDFSNAVKALDQALKSNNTSGAAEAFANLQRAQKRIQQERIAGPAEDVPGRPRTLGGTINFQTVRSDALTKAPGRATGEQTARIAKADSANAQHAAAEQAFITRQDLAAKAVQPQAPTEDAKPIGSTINTKA